MTVRTANCGSCGAVLEFGPGSFLLVCPACGGASWRTDLGLENIGKVAEVAPIASLLELGTRGRYGNLDWVAVGQVQLDHGSGPWNEWCLEFSLGGHGWLAEAQGELLFTQPVDRLPVPPHDRLHPGDPVDLGPKGAFIVAEAGKARVTAVRGQLPVRILPGEPRLYADLRGKDGAFATLDYGDDRHCDAVYVGRTVTPEAMGLDPRRAPGAEPLAAAADRIQCGNCGGEIRLLDPAGAVRVTCASCGALLDAKDPKAVIHRLAMEMKAKPRIPLGAKGRIRGHEVVVLAFLVRAVRVDGVRYDWDEYLLRTSKGSYLWLTDYDGHWNFIEPLGLGDVKRGGTSVEVRGKRFKHFQTAEARILGVLGELYWEAKVGDSVRIEDFVAPPRMVSIETDGKEKIASLGTYVEPGEVKEAFRLPKDLRVPRGVFSDQPNPSGATLAVWISIGAVALVADFLLSLALSAADKEALGFPCCLTMPVLALPVVVAVTRWSSFEASRWNESDHPWNQGE